MAAGQVFGGSPVYILRRITLPLIRQGIATGWMMTFIIAFRELVTASLIAPPNTLVVSTFIVREFEQGSVFGWHGDGGAVCVVFDHGTADLEHGDRSSEGALRWNFLLPGAAANMAATAFMWNRIVLLFWWIAVCWLAQRTTCPG